MPPKGRFWMKRVQKVKKARVKNKNSAQKGAEMKICTHQYLYNSEQLGLKLGRKLYLPPVVWQGSVCGIISVVGSLFSGGEGLSFWPDGGCSIGSCAVSVSVLGSGICLEASVWTRSVVVSMHWLWSFDLGIEGSSTDGSEVEQVSQFWPSLESKK